MDRNPNERPGGKRWLDRAEELLTLAQTVREETRAQLEETKALMERLAADWLLIAALEDERQRPAHDDGRSADERHRNDGGV
jgi:hypothetical protein